MEAWPHQTAGVAEVLAAIARGERRICLTSPTGGGKTLICCELIREFWRQWKRVALYTNRRLLVEQTSRVLEAAGLKHGVRAAGHADDRERDIQVSSIQTEHSRVIKGGQWGLHEADLALVDEAHLNRNATAKTIMDAHVASGAAVVGLTATPLGLGEFYDHLIVAGRPSELRVCGALVPARMFQPDEPDLKGIGRVVVGQDLTDKQNAKAIMRPGIFGRVLTHYKRLNPDQKPTILFGPDVAGSNWFAEQFESIGVNAAHIDGQDVWVDGELHRTNPNLRQEVIARFKAGEIKVLCNRFVLREGVDIPESCVGIFATVFGSLQSYLQSGGRLLRACPATGKTHCTIIDHGGNCVRHGSLNADREWRLEWSANDVTALREEGLRDKSRRCRRCGAKLKHAGSSVCVACGFLNEKEPFVCPQCKQVLATPRCPCGFEIKPGEKSRMVVQTDGTLREVRGDAYKPRRISRAPDGPKKWEWMYWRSKTEKGDRTFRAAAALFASENCWAYPDPSWPFMPKDPEHMIRRVADVPMDKLIAARETQDA